MHYGSFDFIAWVAVLLLGSGMAEAVMPMMMLNNLVAQTRLSIQRIYQVLAMPELSLPLSDQQPQEASITFEQVSFHYPQARTGAALQEVSFHVPAGQIVALVGPSGAGKSTLMNLITDNIRRDGGEILMDGREILEMGDTFRQYLGYMPQQQGMYEHMSAESFLTYIARLKGIRGKAAVQEVQHVLELVNLEAVRHKKLQGFSGGMKQRVLLAQALLGDPKVLILDEPTAGLDPKERVRIRTFIHKLSQDRIVLLATHIVSDIESIADQVLLMKKGKLTRLGTPQELIGDIPEEWTPVAYHLSLEDVYLYFLGE